MLDARRDVDPERRDVDRQNTTLRTTMAPSVEERLARHLRKNRGVRIKLYGTVVPTGWTPEPGMAHKLHLEPTLWYRVNWYLKFKIWHKKLGHDKGRNN